MPPQLLPASAAAFAPRASLVNVVLGSKVEPWLTQTLKRINRVKRPLNSVPQHQKCLTETLSSPNAIWTLTSLMLPKAPEADLRKDANPLIEAIFNHQLIHVEAYIVHVDMVLRSEVAYKLTPDTIEALIEYHKDIHCVNAKASTYDWSEKEQQCKKLHDDFIQAINKFVFRTHVTALEGLEEDGVGELLCGKSDEVQEQHHEPAQAAAAAAPARRRRHPPAAAAAQLARQRRHVVPAHPAVGPARACRVVARAVVEPRRRRHLGRLQRLHLGLGMADIQLPSPTPSYSQPYSTAGLFYSSPVVTAPIPQLPLPSMLAPQCGVSVGYGSFGWDKYQEYTTTM